MSFLVQKALIFKLANLEGAVLTGIIPHLALAGPVSLTKELEAHSGLRNESQKTKQNENPNVSVV